MRRFHGTACSLRYAIEEKVEPRLPVAVAADAIEQAVVLRAVLLEVQTQAQEGLP